MAIDNQHACLPLKVEISIANMVCVQGLVGEKKWKFLKFVVIFWCLKLGQPIVDFESMKMLFDFLKVKNMFCKH
jgi:hypothetical protein